MALQGTGRGSLWLRWWVWTHGGTGYGGPSGLRGSHGPPGQRAGEGGQHWEARAAAEQPSLTCLLVTDILPSLPVHFRYVVFHPFLDEILIGKIKGCSPEGVHGNGGPDPQTKPGSTLGQVARPAGLPSASGLGHRSGGGAVRELRGGGQHTAPSCSRNSEGLGQLRGFTVRPSLRTAGWTQQLPEGARGPRHPLVPVLRGVHCRFWWLGGLGGGAGLRGGGGGLRFPWRQLPLSHAVTFPCVPVSLGFFDDILIPPESLQQPAKLYPPKVKVGHREAQVFPKDSPRSLG